MLFNKRSFLSLFLASLNISNSCSRSLSCKPILITASQEGGASGRFFWRGGPERLRVGTSSSNTSSSSSQWYSCCWGTLRFLLPAWWPDLLPNDEKAGSGSWWGAAAAELLAVICCIRRSTSSCTRALTTGRMRVLYILAFFFLRQCIQQSTQLCIFSLKQTNRTIH